MAGKKGKTGGKPVNQRKAFKNSAAYKKPTTVGVNEPAGSGYREKLRARQQEARSDAGIKYRW